MLGLLVQVSVLLSCGWISAISATITLQSDWTCVANMHELQVASMQQLLSGVDMHDDTECKNICW